MTDTNPYRPEYSDEYNNKHDQPDLKLEIYSANIRRSLDEMVARMATLGECLPDDGEHFNTSDLTPEQDLAIDYIMAIEEEWILDPKIRQAQSMICWDSEEVDDLTP